MIEQSFYSVYFYSGIESIERTLTLFRLGRGGGAFDTTQELNPYYSRTIASTVFLLRDFSSNLPGSNLVLSSFGS